MSAEITYEPLAWCNACAEGPGHGEDQRAWADQHNAEYHPKTETP